MTEIKFKITRYSVVLAREMKYPNRVTVRAQITCIGAKRDTMRIFFLHPRSRKPRNTYDSKSKTATMYIEADHYERFIDLLRNERPVYAYIDLVNPDRCRIYTGTEPVGEGEEP